MGELINLPHVNGWQATKADHRKQWSLRDNYGPKAII